MSTKVLLVILVLIGSECLFLATAKKNVTALEEIQRQDAEIQTMLFGETPHIRECLNATRSGNLQRIQQKGNKLVRPLWTVVILKEDIFKNKTLNIQHCVGSLIHPKVVLTAAHCMFRKSLETLKVRAGECVKRSETKSVYQQESRIESVVIPETYSIDNVKDDIALLFLKDALMSKYIRTVCLPPTDIAPIDIDYAQCTASLWERKSSILLGYANFRNLNFSVIPNKECQQVLKLTGLGESFELHNSFICASGNVKKMVLNGNGGAPMVCPICGTKRMVQFGIMSWGFGTVPLPEVLTSIMTQRQWIANELELRKFKLSSCIIHWKL